MNKKFSLVLFGVVIIAAVIALAIAVGKSNKAGEEEAKEALWENIEDTVDGADSTEALEGELLRHSETIKQMETLSERNEIRFSKLEENADDLDSLKEELESAKSEIEKTKSGLQNTKAEIEETKTNLGTATAGLEASKAGIESAKSTFEEITSKLEKRLQDEDAKLKSSMDSSVSELKSELSDNKAAMEAMAAEIESLRNALADKSETEALKAQIATLEETLGSLAVSYADGLETVRAESYESGFTNGVANGKELALGELNLTHAYSYTSGTCNYQVAGFYKSFFVVCAGINFSDAPSYSVSTSRSGASVQLVSSYLGRYTSNSQLRLCTVWKVSGLEVGDWIYGRANNDPFMIMSVIGVN
ncbi:MAG: hypothetical protein J5537_05925 [Lachnospiraceae bacterium]|nr:hypothetical protein [Lachnospiraceae bacterium]